MARQDPPAAGRADLRRRGQRRQLPARGLHEPRVGQPPQGRRRERLPWRLHRPRQPCQAGQRGARPALQGPRRVDAVQLVVRPLVAVRERPRRRRLRGAQRRADARLGDQPGSHAVGCPGSGDPPRQGPGQRQRDEGTGRRRHPARVQRPDQRRRHPRQRASRADRVQHPPAPGDVEARRHGAVVDPGSRCARGHAAAQRRGRGRAVDHQHHRALLQFRGEPEARDRGPRGRGHRRDDRRHLPADVEPRHDARPAGQGGRQVLQANRPDMVAGRAHARHRSRAGEEPGRQRLHPAGEARRPAPDDAAAVRDRGGRVGRVGEPRRPHGGRAAVPDARPGARA